jgi:hypothetical protein
MARFYYLVYVDVEDGLVEVSGGDHSGLAEFHVDASEYDGEDEALKSVFSPEARANIVMSERLGCDDDYGFDYTIDYERKD